MASRKRRATLVLLRRGRQVVAAMTPEGHPTWGQLKALKAFSDGRLPLVWDEGPDCFFTRIARLITVVTPAQRHCHPRRRNHTQFRFDQLSLFPDSISSQPK
jgi:hypothetical protein